MFDYELTSVIAIFAGIAALIAYISERAKRRIKASGQPFKLKKMPRAQDATIEQSSLEDWYFPQPSQDKSQPSELNNQAAATEIPPSPASSPDASLQQYEATHPAYREIENVVEHSFGRTPHKHNVAHSRFGTRARLREAIITMTVLGPCRALTPHQEREHY